MVEVEVLLLLLPLARLKTESITVRKYTYTRKVTYHAASPHQAHPHTPHHSLHRPLLPAAAAYLEGKVSSANTIKRSPANTKKT